MTIDMSHRWRVFTVVVVVGLLAALLGQQFLFTFSLKENSFEFDEVLHVIGPALIASLFIERAVEVVVQTWRKFGRQKIEQEINHSTDVIKDLQESEDTDANKNEISKVIEHLKESKAELVQYRSVTIQMAASFALFFSFLVALIGVRLLTPFFEIDSSMLDCITGLEIEPEECASGIESARNQYQWLVSVDVFITTFVIAGGSAGLHSIVSAITSFADKTSDLNRGPQ